MLLSVRYSIVWSYITFSIILETIGRSVIGLKFIRSVLVPFSYRGLSFASSQSFTKWESLMDKLQTYVMRMDNTYARSFKNLPDTSSIPAVLLMLHAFGKFEIAFDWTVWKCSLLWLNSHIIVLVVYSLTVKFSSCRKELLD